MKHGFFYQPVDCNSCQDGAEYEDDGKERPDTRQAIDMGPHLVWCLSQFHRHSS